MAFQTPRNSAGAAAPKVRSKPGPATELGVPEAAKSKDAKEASKPTLKVGPPPARRVEFWKDFYAKRDVTTADVLETVQLLRANGDMTDVEAVLGGFLYSRPGQAEPWMFGTLVTAIELNKGPTDRVRAWLDYCAGVAERSGNPNHLLAVADLMLAKGELDRVGSLLDATAEKVPHRVEPLRMMLLLARQAKDPERMASAVERLLELGWPGADDAIRREARTQADDLAKALRAAGRDAEATALMKRVAAAEPRDLVIRLSWTGYADFDLEVEEPLGAMAAPKSPRTVFGGALVKNGRGRSPEEVYVCPRGFDGDYVVRVEPIFNDPDHPVERATLEATLHEGTPDERKQTWKLALDHPEPVVIRLEGGRRTEILPYTAAAEKGPRLRPGPLLKRTAPDLLLKPTASPLASPGRN